LVARTTTSGTVVVVAEGVAGPALSVTTVCRSAVRVWWGEDQGWMQGRRGRADGLQPPRS
jgi:hypothetical protein